MSANCSQTRIAVVSSVQIDRKRQSVRSSAHCQTALDSGSTGRIMGPKLARVHILARLTPNYSLLTMMDGPSRNRGWKETKIWRD